MANDLPDFSRLTFKEAFAAARKGGGKQFSWNGKRYTTELAEDKPAKAKDRDTGPDESAAETARLKSAGDKARRADVEAADKPLESSHPEMMVIGGPGLKALQRGAKGLAEASTARKAATEAAERIEPRLGVPRPIVRAPDRIEPTFKKGGAVRSSASKRADGIAQRGKTKGKIY